ncbi:MAG: MBL fold metallo-hydrolase [Gemmatimonadales bacterium]|nr:MBL fold metallo-hydrolase [Gemmatimonadales bacterium]
MPIIRSALAACVAATSSTPLLAQSPTLAPPRGSSVVPVAPGVFVILHPRATDNFPNGNSMVVVGDDGVLVVDTGYLPSVAREDIAWIKTLTPKPVRYVVNTHWHYDHNNGNADYRKAFPGVEIVAHRETQRLIALNSARYAAGVVVEGSGSRKTLEAYRTQLTSDTSLTPVERDTVRARIAQREREMEEMGTLAVEPPTRTFDRELNLRLGGRQIRLLHLARGNTPGDVVVWLPAEQVVAVGDLLVHPIPYAYNSIPHEWVAFLRGVDSLGARTIVPGHGPVFRDPAYLRQVTGLLESVVNHVFAGYRAGQTVDQVRAGFDFGPWRDRFAGTNDFLRRVFDGSIVTALVDRAFLAAGGGL